MGRGGPRACNAVRRRRTAAALAALVVLALVSTGRSSPRPSGPPASGLQPLIHGTLPVVAEHRYRLAARIRPLLLFWIGRDNVGSARMRWRRGEGDARGYDLLIGSDPARAPRGVNRWGFILEEAHPEGATVVGVMKKSDEESLDEAKSRVAAEAGGGVVFKMIQATVTRAESVARVTACTVPKDYSYRELGVLVDALSKATALPTVRRVPVPPGGKVGLLTGIADLIHDGVEEVRRTGRAPGRQAAAYAYHAKQYEVSRVSSALETNAAYGGVTYAKLLRSDFTVRARGESWTESFTIVVGVAGPLAEIPVFLTYQPRWWFKVEMVLDESQAF